MAKKGKLELAWVGKDDRPRLEPRILIEDPARSYHAKMRNSENDIFSNMLIKGDNLLALKALEQDYSGLVKCIYIDPPFNTGNAFEHYDDGVEHSIWLNLMRERLEILRRLLRKDGFLCAHIDDSEGHYLKVLLDEVFGRENYQTTIYLQVRYPQKTLKQDMSYHKQIEMVHVYRNSFDAKPWLTPKASGLEKFNFYVSTEGEGKEIELGGKRTIVFEPGDYKIEKGEPSVDGRKEIWATGSILDGNSSGRFFRDYLDGRISEDGLGALYKVYGIGDDKFDHRFFTGPKRATATKGKYFQGVPTAKLENADSGTQPIENFLDLAGAFGNCRHEGGVEFRSGKKPEVLLQKILTHFSNENDLVLDSFAGSGTTAAVAHKMKRKWITVEIGEHCETHVIPRLTGIIDGTDLTGASENLAWKGGGGFRYYTLAPSLIETDRFGMSIISKEYNAAMLAEAMCKHLGFTYAPSDIDYWNHGYSTETDFIYVTTQSLTHDTLRKISADVGKGRTLLVCCKAYSGGENLDNLTIHKIPSIVLDKCEWGRDDYSLNVANLPMAEEEDPDADLPLFAEGGSDDE